MDGPPVLEQLTLTMARDQGAPTRCAASVEADARQLRDEQDAELQQRDARALLSPLSLSLALVRSPGLAGVAEEATSPTPSPSLSLSLSLSLSRARARALARSRSRAGARAGPRARGRARARAESESASARGRRRRLSSGRDGAQPHGRARGDAKRAHTLGPSRPRARARRGCGRSCPTARRSTAASARSRPSPTCATSSTCTLATTRCGSARPRSRVSVSRGDEA